MGVGNMSFLPRRDNRHMTVSRLERAAGRTFSDGFCLSMILSENRFPIFGIMLLAGNPGEIRDLVGGGADAGEQRQTVGAHRLILIIDENPFKE